MNNMDSKHSNTVVDKEPVNKHQNYRWPTTGVSQGEKSVDSPIPHPYAEAIERCPCNEWQLEERNPVPFNTLEETHCTMVDSVDLFHQMMSTLRLVKEIAVASKRDTYRSFKGRCCLLQISTRSADFLVDSLALKDNMLEFNELFTDSGILKVMYKAENIVASLHKDFGLYVVNLFELYSANRDISAESDQPHGSMYLLFKELCSVELPVFKQWHKRRHEWDVRPLSPHLLKIACQETHYMLHAKDKLQNSLLKKNILKEFYTKCNRICSTISLSSQDVLDLSHTSYTSIFNNGYNESLSETQKEVVRVLYIWRYETAKMHDEGATYVLPTKYILSIAKRMPTDAEGVRSCIGSRSVMSPLLEEDLEKVHNMIFNITRPFKEACAMEKLESELVNKEPNENETAIVGKSGRNDPGSGVTKTKNGSTEPGVNSAQKVAKRKSGNSVDPPKNAKKKKKKSGENESNTNAASVSTNNSGRGGRERFPGRGRGHARPLMDSAIGMFTPAMGSTMGKYPFMEQRLDPRNGVRMGSGMGPRMGSRMGQGMGRGMDSAMDWMSREKGPGIGPAMGPRTGPGMGPGNCPGIGPGNCPGIGPGNGPGIGPGNGPGIGPGNGQGIGPGNGQGIGPGNGQGIGPGNGQGIGPGNGQGIGPGNGQGIGPGNGSGMGPGMGPRMGLGTGPGTGPRMRPGLDHGGSGMGLRTGPGIGPGMNSRMGTPQYCQQRNMEQERNRALASVIVNEMVDMMWP